MPYGECNRVTTESIGHGGSLTTFNYEEVPHKPVGVEFPVEIVVGEVRRHANPRIMFFSLGVGCVLILMVLAVITQYRPASSGQAQGGCPQLGSNVVTNINITYGRVSLSGPSGDQCRVIVSFKEKGGKAGAVLSQSLPYDGQIQGGMVDMGHTLYQGVCLEVFVYVDPVKGLTGKYKGMESQACV